MKIIEKDGKGAMVEFPYCHYHRNYVARITGTDPKYGLAREFCGEKVGMSSSGKNGWIRTYVGEDDLLEYRDGNVYKGENAKYYYIYQAGEVKEISSLEARRIAENIYVREM